MQIITMDARTRIMTTLEFEEPDRVPWFESAVENVPITKEYGGKVATNGLYRMLKILRYVPFRTKVYNRMANFPASMPTGYKPLIKLYRNMGIDLFPVALTLLMTKNRIWWDNDGFPWYTDEMGRQFKVWHNKDDKLDILSYMGGEFTSTEDFFKWGELEVAHPVRLALLKMIKKTNDKYSDIFLMPMVNGLMEVTWEAFGFNTFSRLLLSRSSQKDMEKVFEMRGKFALELVKLCLDHDIELIGAFDDMGFKTGPMMSPRMYEKYVFPWHKRIADKCHSRGAKYFLHSCGNITSLLDLILDAGIDVLNPIEPTANNNIEEIRKKTYGKLALCGNVSPQALNDKTPAEIQEIVKHLLSKIAPGGGYIFGSGHSINPGVTQANFAAMKQTFEKHNDYPL